MGQLDLAQSLKDLIGENKISTSQPDIEAHSIDKWLVSHPPDVVVFVESTEDVVRVMRFSHENKVPVTARGAGVGYVGGAVPTRGGIVLSVARMKKIKEISPEDGIAVVEPGVITGDLQDAVREVGYFYPPDPASLRECSMGGNVAVSYTHLTLPTTSMV